MAFGNSSTDSSTGSSITITPPYAIAAGKLWFCAISKANCDPSTQTWTIPTGWTELVSARDDIAAGATAGGSLRYYWIVATTGNIAAAQTWTDTTGATGNFTIAWNGYWSGRDNTAGPIAGTATHSTAANSTPITAAAPAITVPLHADVFVVAHELSTGNNICTITDPGSYSPTSYLYNLEVATTDDHAAGSSASGNQTLNNTSSYTAAFNLRQFYIAIPVGAALASAPTATATAHASFFKEIAGSAATSAAGSATLTVDASMHGNAVAVATAHASFLHEIAGGSSSSSSGAATLSVNPTMYGNAVAKATGKLNTTAPAALVNKYDSTESSSSSYGSPGTRTLRGTGTGTLSIKAGLVNDMIVVGFISDATTITFADSGWLLLTKVKLTGAAAIYDMARSLSVYYRADTKGNGDVTGTPDTYDFTTSGGGYTQTSWTTSRWRNPKWDTYDPLGPFEAIRFAHPVAGAGSGDWVWTAGTGVGVATIPSVDALDANDAMLLFWADQDFSYTDESTRAFTAGLTAISDATAPYGAFAPEDYIRGQYKMLSSSGATGDFVQTIQPGLPPTSVHHPNYNRSSANIAIVLRSQLATGALMRGAAVANSTATGDIPTVISALTAAPKSVATGTGLLKSVTAALASTPAAQATLAGHLVMPSAVLATAPTGIATATGALTAQTQFTDAAAGTATATGGLTNTILLAAVSTGASTAVGNLTVGAGFKGAAVAVATASLDARWEVSAKAAATATAVLLASIRAAAAATCQATATGTLGPFVAVREGITVRLGTNELTAHVASPIELTANDFLVLS